jgi:adenine-specific DNA-methyltransferase
MTDKQIPNSSNFWSENLGLLPVPLVSDNRDQVDSQPSVLLNGSNGNFVLDWTDYAANEDPRNLAWSSNVGHYVMVKGNLIEVKRWDKNRAFLERYHLKSVVDNLERFHSYLEHHNPHAELSIVAQTIKVFRRLRTMLGPDETGADSLQAFLYLLACATDGTDRGKLDPNRWRLSSSAGSVAASISSNQWDMLIDEIQRGRPTEQLIPHLDLLLRHAAGQLFQEAHYEAVFMPQVQLLLEGFLPNPVDVRKGSRRMGVHFTPPFLVRTLVEAALEAETSNATNLTIFDPACGSGEFLREALRQLKLRGNQRPIHLIGWDISEAACAMANFVLAAEQRGMSDVTIDIECVDALATDRPWPKPVDMVVMNPPFLSWQDMESAQRSHLLTVLGPLAGPRSDLSHAFVLKAVASLRPDGVFSTVLPASFLISESARPIRANLVDQLAPRLIARLGSQLLFPGALVDAACYVANKSADMKTATIAFWADPGRSSSTTGLRMLRKLRYWADLSAYPVHGNGFSIYLHPSLGRADHEQERSTWSPPPYKSWRLYQNLSALPRVSDLFVVRQGARTGYNQVFLLDPSEWEELPATEKRYFRPAVVNDAIQDGMLHIVKYVFYPYGEHEIKTEAELVRVVPEYYQHYLYPNYMQLRGRARTNEERWWGLTWPRTWQAAPRAKLVSTYFGDAGSFAFDTTGEFVVVQGLNWQAKKKVSSISTQRKIYLAYLAVLNSSLFSDLLAATSYQVSGGQWNLSKHYVDPIPLPDFFDQEFSPVVIEELARIGEQERGAPGRSDDRILDLLAPLYRLHI